MGQGDSRSKTSFYPHRREERDPEYNPAGEEEDARTGNRKKRENQRRDMAGRNHLGSLRPNGKKKESERFQSDKMSPCHLRDSRSIGYGNPQKVRCGYPQSSPSLTPNLDFYQNKISFQPNGVYIQEILTKWKDDYRRLEKNHSYIQWLFPLREQGKNPSAAPLTEDEIQMMRQDRDVMRRFLEAYKLMLGFYGIELMDEHTGEVERAKNWRERSQNLNSHSHNNLRITRILKCLGIMDCEHLQAPLVEFFLKETLYANTLPNVKKSALDYFRDTVKDNEKRSLLDTYVHEHHRPQRDKKTSYSNKNRLEVTGGRTAVPTAANPRPVKDTHRPSTSPRNRSHPIPVTTI